MRGFALGCLVFVLGCGAVDAPPTPILVDGKTDSTADTLNACGECVAPSAGVSTLVRCLPDANVDKICGGGIACAEPAIAKMYLTTAMCAAADIHDNDQVGSDVILARLGVIEPTDGDSAVAICAALHEAVHVHLGVCDRSRSEIAAYTAEIACLANIAAKKCDATKPLWAMPECSEVDAQQHRDGADRDFNQCITDGKGCGACTQTCLDVYVVRYTCEGNAKLYCQNSCHPEK